MEQKARCEQAKESQDVTFVHLQDKAQGRQLMRFGLSPDPAEQTCAVCAPEAALAVAGEDRLC